MHEYPESVARATEEALWVIHHWWIHRLGRKTHPRIMGFTFQVGEIIIPEEDQDGNRQYREVNFTALVAEYHGPKQNEVVAQLVFSVSLYQYREMNSPWFPRFTHGTITHVPSGETEELDWMPSDCMDERTQRGDCRLNRLETAINYFA